MHPLRHPRNAALVGIMFVVIAIVYSRSPTSRGWRCRLRHRGGHDHAPRPRRRDGDHGLRPRRRISGRVTGRGATAPPDADARCSNGSGPAPRTDGRVRHARLGRAHRAASRSPSRSSSSFVLAVDVPAAAATAPPARRGQAAHRAADAGRHPHAGTVVRPGLRGGRRVPAVPRASSSAG